MADKKYISDCGGLKKEQKLPKNLHSSTTKKTITTQSKSTTKGKK